MLLMQVSRAGVYSLAFSPDSMILYCGDGRGWVHAWDRATDKQDKLFHVEGHPGVGRLAVSNDGQRILAANHGGFRGWDAATKELWPEKPVLASNYRFALAPDNRTLAAVVWGEDSRRIREDYKTVVFSDLMVRGPHPTRPALRLSSWVDDLAFSPTDGTLAVVGEDGALYLIAPDADQPVRINDSDVWERYQTDILRHLAFSADGRTLAFRSGRSISLWDMQTRQVRRTIKISRVLPWDLAFHPNGKLLAIAGKPLVTLWDTSTGRKVNSYDWSIGKEILSLAFAPDGMTAAAGSNTGKVVLWDLDV